MSLTKRNSYKRFFLSFAILGFIFSLFVSFYFSAKAEYFFLDQEDYLSVSNVFLLALSENNLEVLKSLVSEENHEFLTSWTKNHTDTSCSRIPSIPGFDRPDFEGVSGLSGDGMHSTVQWTMYIPCPNDQNLYCLKVENLRLSKTADNQWKIQNWDDFFEYQAVYRC